MARSALSHAYDVFVTRHSDTYRPRTYRAVLASDRQCCRIGFYWLDPAEEIEPTDAPAFSDFIFEANQVSYWHHKEKWTHAFPLEPCSPDQGVRLPTGKGLEPILGSILTLIVHSRTGVVGQEGALGVSRFFQGGRGHDYPKCTSQAPAGNETCDLLVSAWGEGDGAILDRLPFGRTYSKQTDREGNIVWRMSKTAVPIEKARVMLRPIPLRNMPGRSEIGDPNTLGRWSAVPEAYRSYWSLRDRSVNLRRKPNIAEAEQLHADVTSALRGTLPDDVNAPLRELLFRVSLQTGADEAIRSSASQYFSAYVRLAQEPVERIVIELGRIGQELRARWAEDQTRNFIRPLLQGIVGPEVFSDPEFVTEGVLRWIHTQGPTWSWYEQMVRETVQEVTGVHPESAVRVPRAPDEHDRTAAMTDSEPNEETPADARQHE